MRDIGGSQNSVDQRKRSNAASASPASGPKRQRLPFKTEPDDHPGDAAEAARRPAFDEGSSSDSDVEVMGEVPGRKLDYVEVLKVIPARNASRPQSSCAGYRQEVLVLNSDGRSPVADRQVKAESGQMSIRSFLLDASKRDTAVPSIHNASGDVPQQNGQYDIGGLGQTASTHNLSRLSSFIRAASTAASSTTRGSAISTAGRPPVAAYQIKDEVKAEVYDQQLQADVPNGLAGSSSAVPAPEIKEEIKAEVPDQHLPDPPTSDHAGPYSNNACGDVPQHENGHNGGVPGAVNNLPLPCSSSLDTPPATRSASTIAATTLAVKLEQEADDSTRLSASQQDQLELMNQLLLASINTLQQLEAKHTPNAAADGWPDPLPNSTADGTRDETKMDFSVASLGEAGDPQGLARSSTALSQTNVVPKVELQDESDDVVFRNLVLKTEALATATVLLSRSRELVNGAAPAVPSEAPVIPDTNETASAPGSSDSDDELLEGSEGSPPSSDSEDSGSHQFDDTDEASSESSASVYSLTDSEPDSDDSDNDYVADLLPSPPRARGRRRKPPCDAAQDEPEADDGDLPEDPQYPNLRRGIVLKPHQRSGVEWMRERDSQAPHAGILADEMGLGKSGQAITLVLSTHGEPDPLHDAAYDALPPVKKNRLLKSRCTLVVAPASVVYQWNKEFGKFVKHGTLSYYVYYGPNKIDDTNMLAQYDVVITSFNTLAYQHDALTGRVTERVFMPGHVSNDNRRAVPRISTLLNIYWRRVILDEAHYIKNTKVRNSQACCALEATKRWCLTGTPVHKDLRDMFALAYFMRIPGYTNLGDAGFLTDTSTAGVADDWNRLTQQIVLRRMKSEKCQETDQPLIDLPTRRVETVEVKLEGAERDMYDTMLGCVEEYYKEWLANKKYLSRNKENSPRWVRLMRQGFFGGMSIDVFYLRCRQAAAIDKDAIFAALEDDGTEDRASGSVLQPKAEEGGPSGSALVATTEAGEVAAGEVAAGEEVPSGSILRQKIRERIAIGRDDFNRIYMNNHPSAKMEAMMTRLVPAVAKGDKCVVVTQWTSLFPVIECHLNMARITYTTIEGKVPLKRRQQNIEAFNMEGCGPKVMILSLCAGGTGVNLVGGNHLFILDLHWNPALEAQACDRVHRLGQTKEVFVYKLVSLNTVEESLLDRQDKKSAIIQAILSSTMKAGGGRIRPEHYQTLFGFKNLSTVKENEAAEAVPGTSKDACSAEPAPDGLAEGPGAL
ncbi:SNF2 family N-terminal domain containing protein [Aphelenchoides avenae]|nr:SNF2 family N-terminal domain containing protein [Aphelenchus avenae]